MANFVDKLKGLFSVDYNDELDDDEFNDDYPDNDRDQYDDDDNTYNVPSSRKTSFSNKDRINRSRENKSSSSSGIRNPFSRGNKSDAKSGSNIVPMKKKNSSMELVVIKPSMYEQSKEVIDLLVEDKGVIINLEGMKLDLAQRIVDTVSGGTYAIDGNLKRISGYIYLLTPPNVDISGDFQEMLDNASYSDSSTDYSSRY